MVLNSHVFNPFWILYLVLLLYLLKGNNFYYFNFIATLISGRTVSSYLYYYSFFRIFLTYFISIFFPKKKICLVLNIIWIVECAIYMINSGRTHNYLI